MRATIGDLSLILEDPIRATALITADTIGRLIHKDHDKARIREQLDEILAERTRMKGAYEKKCEEDKDGAQGKVEKIMKKWETRTPHGFFFSAQTAKRVRLVYADRLKEDIERKLRERGYMDSDLGRLGNMRDECEYDLAEMERVATATGEAASERSLRVSIVIGNATRDCIMARAVLHGNRIDITEEIDAMKRKIQEARATAQAAMVLDRGGPPEAT
jgi:uncharacterized protein YicC (UPF0701 family)